MNEMIAKPNYLEFLDFRKLIDDFVVWKNSTSKGRFSYRNFAQKCGFKSPNYIRLIVQGKRNLSSKAALAIVKAMKLSNRETDFFINLVGFNQAIDAETKSLYFEKIASYKEFAICHQITKDQFEYFSKWYNVAIREMMSLNDFKLDYDWISLRLTPTVPPREIKKAIELLLRLKLIKRSASGKWQLCDHHVETDVTVTSAFLMNFHREMILLSQQSLKQPQNERNISAMTMAIGEEEFEEISHRLRAFQKEIQNYLAKRKTRPDRVYQLNHQFFYLTKKEE